MSINVCVCVCVCVYIHTYMAVHVNMWKHFSKMINEVCINTYGTHKNFLAKMITLELFSRLCVKFITFLLQSSSLKTTQLHIKLGQNCLEYTLRD
jgi:hypothetical protein